MFKRLLAGVLAAILYVAPSFVHATPAGSAAPTSLPGISYMGYALRQQGWSVISAISNNLSNTSGKSVQSMYGTDINGSSIRMWETSPVSVSRIKFVFGNWIGTANPADEGAAPNDILVDAAVINTATGEVWQAYQNGDDIISIPSRKVVVSDDVPFKVTAGTPYLVSEWCGGRSPTAQCPANLASVTTNWNPSSTEGLTQEDGVPLTGSGIFNSANSGLAYGHLLILGFTGTAHVPSLLCDGDSIMAGTGDASGQRTGVLGWCSRVANGDSATPVTWPPSSLTVFGLAMLGRSGDTLANFVSSSQNKMHLEVASFFTDVISDRGVNDLGGTLATMEANKLTEACLYASVGVHFIATTLTPRTTSTDGWTTVANQTLVSSAGERIQYNDWIRDPGPTGFVQQAAAQCGVPASTFGTFDSAAPVEVNSSNVLTQDGGYWLAPSGIAAYSGSVGSGQSTSGFVDTGLSTTVNQYRGYTLTWTAGANAGTNTEVIYSTAGQLLSTLGFVDGAPNAGDTYKLWSYASGQCVYTQDGTHPTSCGHQLIAASFNRALVQ